MKLYLPEKDNASSAFFAKFKIINITEILQLSLLSQRFY